MMTDHLLRAFDLLIKSGELGAADGRSLNTLSLHLDQQGEAGRDKLIELLFAGSKDPDGACRSFLSRLKAAAQQAADEAERDDNAEAAAVFRSITVARIKAKGGAARLRFSAEAPKELPQVTGRANRDYLEKDYLPSAGSKLEKKDDQLGEKTQQASVGLFISYAVQDKFIVEHFLKLFIAHCEAENPKAAWPVQHWSMNDLTIGENFDQIIRQSLADSDFGLALLSEAFFASPYITGVELTHLLENDKLLPVGLNSKIKGKNATTSQFRRHVLDQYPSEHTKLLYDKQIFYLTDRKGDFFADCDEEGQRKFIRELYVQIQKRINKNREQKKAEQMQEKPLCCHLGCSRQADYCGDEFEPTIGNRHNVRTSGKRMLVELTSGRRIFVALAASRHKKDESDSEEEKTSYEALADLFDWLENSKTSLYALLGDYGMGKTFTCRVFAQQLAERCATNPNLPKPVYLDLRDVPTFIRDGNITRQPTLEEMLQEVLRLAEKGADYSAEELIEAARQGLLLLIFDGLDEKLVYYTNDMRSQFLNELLRVFPQDGRARVKIVISCRTHHFETISQMDSFLLGLNRSGVQGEDYRALHLLPFSSSQILRLLTRLLGSEDANRVFSFIDSEAYLKDLAQRPFMLRQLSRTLPDLQQRKSQGLPINAAAFYQAMIADSISRDDEKHILKPRHKQQLLTDLAAEFWQNSTQVQQIDQLNDWFCAWLETQPALAAQYRKEDWQVLEKDLRNSTLLVRFGEQDFGFSHSSMQEFFLSKWLLRQWQEDDQFRIDQPVSSLTRQFVFDNLALLDKKELERINKGLAATLARPWSNASSFALNIIAELAQQKRTLPELGDVDLRHSFLSNRQIRGLHGQRLLLDQAEAHASQWLDCHFQRIEVGRSDLSESLWRNCCWQKIDTSIAVFDSLQRVTMVNCQGSAAFPELHILPSFQKSITPMNFSPANLMQVNYGKIHSCCFSPDGTRILSACDDDMLKLWNTDGSCIQTFYGYTICCFSPNGTRILASKFSNLILLDLSDNELKYFIGHEEKIDSFCFSPNGQIILSASEEDSLKLWDLGGRCIETFYTDYSEYEVNYIDDYAYRVTCCCFSPDGTRILLGAAGATSKSFGYTLRIWNLEGLCLQTFYGHEGWINSCCFNPDGTRILSAADDKTLKLWDLEGKCLVTMQGHSRAVNSCAFSPDGTCILSASDDGTLKLWDLSGCCLQTFQGHKSEVLICCFSPDGGRILSASDDGTMRLWNLDGTVERIFSAWEEQWYTAFFSSNQLEKIIGTELSWKMANFAKDGETWTLDETGCFAWVPAQY